MGTYQGTCKYCGNTQLIMAMDQIDADEKISEECSCGGAKLERRKEALLQNIKQIVGKEAPNSGLSQVTTDQEQLITDLALGVLHGKIEAATIKLAGLKVSVSGVEKVKIRRTDVKNKLLEA